MIDEEKIKHSFHASSQLPPILLETEFPHLNGLSGCHYKKTIQVGFPHSRYSLALRLSDKLSYMTKKKEMVSVMQNITIL